MTCGLGSACYYRDGQAVAVDTGSGSVNDTGMTGTWTVTANQELEFKIDVSSTDLVNYSSIAMHWGETCQNDVIEGQVNMVPVPGPLSLTALGLVLLGTTAAACGAIDGRWRVPGPAPDPRPLIRVGQRQVHAGRGPLRTTGLAATLAA